MRDKAARALAAIDDARARERPERLADGRARAAVCRGQFVLERNAMPRRPCTRSYACLALGADAYVEAHASSRARAARLRAANGTRDPRQPATRIRREWRGASGGQAWG